MLVVTIDAQWEGMGDVGSARYEPALLPLHARPCNEMYAKLNLLCLQFGMSSPDVLYKLFNSYCMSLYGSQLWNYENKSGMDSLYIAWRKCVRRIFNIPCNTHCKLVPLICKDSAIHTKLYKRFLRFFINAKKSENSILSTMTKHVLSGSSSKACKTLNFICYTYNIQNKYTISESCIPKLKDDEDETKAMYVPLKQY